MNWPWSKKDDDDEEEDILKRIEKRLKPYCRTKRLRCGIRKGVLTVGKASGLGSVLFEVRVQDKDDHEISVKYHLHEAPHTHTYPADDYKKVANILLREINEYGATRDDNIL